MEIPKDVVEKQLEYAHEQIKYWEKQYRIAYAKNDTFYKKCYHRQINRWQAEFETLRWILSLEVNKNGEN